MAGVDVSDFMAQLALGSSAARSWEANLSSLIQAVGIRTPFQGDRQPPNKLVIPQYFDDNWDYDSEPEDPWTGEGEGSPYGLFGKPDAGVCRDAAVAEKVIGFLVLIQPELAPA